MINKVIFYICDLECLIYSNMKKYMEKKIWKNFVKHEKKIWKIYKKTVKENEKRKENMKKYFKNI